MIWWHSILHFRAVSPKSWLFTPTRPSSVIQENYLPHLSLGFPFKDPISHSNSTYWSWAFHVKLCHKYFTEKNNMSLWIPMALREVTYYSPCFAWKGLSTIRRVVGDEPTQPSTESMFLKMAVHYLLGGMPCALNDIIGIEVLWRLQRILQMWSYIVMHPVLAHGWETA